MKPKSNETLDEISLEIDTLERSLIRIKKQIEFSEHLAKISVGILVVAILAIWFNPRLGSALLITFWIMTFFNIGLTLKIKFAFKKHHKKLLSLYEKAMLQRTSEWLSFGSTFKEEE